MKILNRVNSFFTHRISRRINNDITHVQGQYGEGKRSTRIWQSMFSINRITRRITTDITHVQG